MGYHCLMTQLDGQSDAGVPRLSRLGLSLLCGGGLAVVIAGLLLWWREGSRLFTDGLIAAIVACF